MNYIGNKDKLYQGEKQTISACLRYLYALFYLIDIGQGRIKLFNKNKLSYAYRAFIRLFCRW